MRSSLLRALSCLMVVVISVAPILADSNAAMLHAKGSVLLNGGKAASASAIFAGDTLQTAEDGSVAITSKGSTVLVAPRSSVVFGSNSLEVLCGAAVVSTSRGMGAQVNNLSIAPAGEKARFQVLQTADQLQVAATEGDLLVNDGQRTVTLKVGNALEAKGGCSKAAAYQVRAGAPPAAPYQMGAESSLIWLAFIIPIAVGITIALVATNDPPSDVSPTLP